MQEEIFNQIRVQFCSKDELIRPGKMMSSEAITYKGKVFAFFSRKKKMVFKLGKDFDPGDTNFEIDVFNPFKNRAPLSGWFEVPCSEKDQWMLLCQQALEVLREEL